MKIIEMERRTLDGKPVEYGVGENGEDHRDWWCVIETEEEKIAYDDFVRHLGEYSGDCRDILWNKMVIHAGQGMGVKWGDDDMYGYVHPDEIAPLSNKTFIDGDGDEWIVLN